MSPHRPSPSRPLSAQIKAKPDLGHSALWALNGHGRLVRVTDRGGPVPVDLPGGWEGHHLVSSGGTLWVTATQNGRNCLFSLEDDRAGWQLVLELEDLSALVADKDGSIWRLGPAALTRLCPSEKTPDLLMDFQAIHVSFSGDGTVWAVGGDPRFGGSSVWRYAPSEPRWILLRPPAAAVRIAGAPDGMAWTLNNRGDIWRLHPNGAGSFNECGLDRDCINCLYSKGRERISDVAVDGAGTVWWVRMGDGGRVLVEVLTDPSTKSSRQIGVINGVRAIAATII